MTINPFCPNNHKKGKFSQIYGTENLGECGEESLELLLSGVAVLLEVGAELLVVVEGVLLVAGRVVVGGHDVEALDGRRTVDGGRGSKGASHEGEGADDEEGVVGHVGVRIDDSCLMLELDLGSCFYPPTGEIQVVGWLCFVGGWVCYEGSHARLSPSHVK